MAKIRSEEQIELEYSPMQFTKRKFDSCEQLIETFVNICTEESILTRKNIPFETISYGVKGTIGFEKECFDLYNGTAGADDTRPVFVYVHGGYWQMDVINKDGSAYCVQPLIRAGYRVIVLDYENCPNITLEELVKRFCNACKFIINYANTKLNAKFISFAGHSAGAHLLAYMIYKFYQSNIDVDANGDENQLISIEHRNLIKSIYLISGIYDLTEVRFTTQNPNNALSITDENVIELSPLKNQYDQMTSSSTSAADDHQQLLKIHIYVGADESPVFIEQSENLSKLFPKNQCNFVLMENYDHFNIVEELCNADYIITKSIVNELE